MLGSPVVSTLKDSKNRYILKQLPSLDDKALEEVSHKVWTLQMERSLSEKRRHK